jgi:Concanavalin A-like lectin/glucanases superfamily/Carbohydrate binding domain
MRPYPLYNLKQGINRLRIKGGANPSSLYDLVNGWIAVDGSVGPREGTIRAQTLNGNTKGLMADNGIFNVFSITQQSVPSGYVDNLLINPNDATQAIQTIWFAKPFMGFPYVVAQFANGDVFHYWLQNAGKWAANTVYTAGTLILPLTTPTGLAYLAQRVSAVNPSWQPETGVALNTIIEPTQYTGYQYKAVAVAGASPHTGASEPVWPIISAGTIQEFGDFDTSATDAGTTQGSTPSTAQPLATTITDRYGDSSTIASAGTSAGGTLVLPAAASTKVTTWTKGTAYAPGAVVQPSTTQGAFVNAIPNGDFESGNDGNWILTGGVTFNTASPYQGTDCLQFTAAGSTQTATMNTFGLVTPGQSVTATAYVNPNNSGANLSMGITLRWYDASDTFLSNVNSPLQENGGYRLASVTGVAPVGAAHVRVQLFAGNGTSAHTGFADLVSWNLATAAPVSNFLFEAVQSVVGSSASTEPTWPTVAGNTVIDGGVTWKAIGTSIITWEAIPIMQSGASEPTWPTVVPIAVHDTSTFIDSNGVHVDTSISWIASSRRITDVKNPNTIAVALNSSHVFAIDADIVPFSAAVDPTDWSSANNAGYLPTGLNNYGDNPAAVLALYRSNLMAFNAGGYQMWQTDPDPANMALLDAQPVGSIYTRAAQSVANDLLFLTEVGVRNLATVGATANMQVGSSGQPIDPLVKAQLPTATNVVPGDPFFSDVSVLISQTIKDSSSNNATITSSGATVATASSPPGYTSYISLDGITGNLQIPQTNPPQGATSDITMEGWLNPDTTTTGQGGIVTNGIGSSFSNFGIYWSQSLQELSGQLFGQNVSTPTNSVPRGAWTYVAISVFNQQLYVFLNGILQPNYPQGVAGPYIYDTLQIGNGSGGRYKGSIAGFRITTNISRYPGFATTPPVTPPGPGVFPSPIIYYTPISLYYPGRGQYWLFFGPQAFVFTVNGQGLRTWSRYIFPDTITDWTLNGGVLYLRSAGNLVWQFDSGTLVDDFNGANIAFKGIIQSPYVDVGPLGIDKELIGVDIVGEGICTLQIGWAQNDPTTFSDNSNFSISTNVTPPFTVNAADTVPGNPIPMPMTAPSFTVILTFAGNQAWNWNASSLYISDVTGTPTG